MKYSINTERMYITEGASYMNECTWAEGSIAPLWSRVVCRPPEVNFLHFLLFLRNQWMEFDKTRQEARSQRYLPSLCFPGRQKNKDGRPGLWLADTFSTYLQPLYGMWWHLIGSKYSTSSTKIVFWGRSKNKDGRLGLRLAQTPPAAAE